MAAKQKRLSDELNVELSRISSALSIAAAILSEMPDSQQKGQIKKLIDQAEEGHKRAADIAISISRAASQI